MKFDNGHHARMSVSGAIGGALYGKERLAGRAAFNARYPLHVPGPCVVPNPSRAFADLLASVGAVGRTTRQSDEYIVQALEQWWLEWNQRTYKKYLKDKEAQDKQYGAFVLDPSLFDS
ncbi:hypothetical protein M8818_001238 [Zalaria obscura]|uniref:Uncharacterized protein n=1 Tax=Zalaria obscura TaxID=2024903 RepID=A0ACC3SL90_9PEZI